jgi:LmbE family N-acetylglucosaminyl deacetylase
MSTNIQDLSNLSVLAVFAHPDDEGFGSGGTLAMLAARGAHVTLVCATNGDVGEISDPALATPETLAQVRQEELRKAMAVAGVSDVRFLNYRDSGMAGTEDNNHPNSLHQSEPGRVVRKLVSIIREVRPEVVITHDPSGGYGHPDHKAVCQHTTQAFSLAGDDNAYSEQLTQERLTRTPKLLYYICFPRSNFRRMWQQMLDLNITPPFASQDIDSLGTPDEAVTTVLNVSQYVDTKIASLNCHRTQIDPNGPFSKLPVETVREYMSTEYYTLARPERAGKGEDLLAGL